MTCSDTYRLCKHSCTLTSYKLGKINPITFYIKKLNIINSKSEIYVHKSLTKHQNTYLILDEGLHSLFLIGNQKSIINERKMRKQEVHDDEQQEIKETNSTTNRG